jgi:hypothetical protein
MKAYVVITGIAFALLTLAHIWRGFVEPHLAREPGFILITIICLALCLWACRLLLRRNNGE